MSGHKTTHSQTERYQIIDRLISSGVCPSFKTILKTIQVELEDRKFSEPSLHRDLKYMKDYLEAPIIYKRKENGYDYSHPYNFPLKNLTEHELVVIAVIKKFLEKYDDSNPLYNEARKVLSKLYPSTDKIDLSSRFVISKGPKPVINNEVFGKVLEAIVKNLEIDFVYRSKWEPGQNHRIVKPCQLIVDNGQIFLYAAGVRKDLKTRLYNLNRMHEVTIMYDHPFELPPDYKFEESFEKGRFGAFQYDEEYDFKIEVYGEARNRLHECIWADNQQLEEFPKDGKTVILFSSSQWIPIEQWLLSFGANAKPLEPDWLVDWWKTEIQKMMQKI